MTVPGLEVPVFNPALVREILPEYNGKNAVVLILEATEQTFGKVVVGILPNHHTLLIICAANESHNVALDRELTALRVAREILPKWTPLWAGGAGFGVDRKSLKVVWANGSTTLGRELTEEMMTYAGKVIARLAEEARTSPPSP